MFTLECPKIGQHMSHNGIKFDLYIGELFK